MFAVTKLSPASLSFLNQIVSSGRSRSNVAAIALARMIASSFTIPSAPVAVPENHYRLTCQIQSTSIVSKINEIAPIDTDMVMAMCRAFFMLRYNSTHPQTYVYSFRKEHVITDFFDITRSFSDDVLKVIATEGQDLAFYANGFRTIVAELKEGESEMNTYPRGNKDITS